MQKRYHSAKRRQCIMHVVDSTCGEGSCHSCKQSGLVNSKPDLLALHAPHFLADAGCLKNRIAGLLRYKAQSQTDEEYDRHCREYGPSLFAEDRFFFLPLPILTHLSKGKYTGTRKDHHGDQLHNIRDHCRVLKWGGRVGSQKTTSVCPQMFDDLKGRYGSHGKVL